MPTAIITTPVTAHRPRPVMNEPPIRPPPWPTMMPPTTISRGPRPPAMPRSISTTSVAIELDQPLVADPECAISWSTTWLTSRRGRSASPAASRVIGPPKMLILPGTHCAVGAAASRQRYAAVQPEQRLPIGGLVLDDDLDVAHRRTQIGRQGAQRVVNRLVERIIETRRRTRIHLRKGARIGAGTETASSRGPCSVGRDTYRVGGTVAGRRGRGNRPSPTATPRAGGSR